MSDTPRTDECIVVYPEENAHDMYVWADFARKLERENAALRAALVECKDTLVEYVHGDIENPARMKSTLDIARAALDAARKEAQP